MLPRHNLEDPGAIPGDIQSTGSNGLVPKSAVTVLLRPTSKEELPGTFNSTLVKCHVL